MIKKYQYFCKKKKIVAKSWVSLTEFLFDPKRINRMKNVSLILANSNQNGYLSIVQYYLKATLVHELNMKREKSVYTLSGPEVPGP